MTEYKRLGSEDLPFLPAEGESIHVELEGIVRGVVTTSNPRKEDETIFSGFLQRKKGMGSHDLLKFGFVHNQSKASFTTRIPAVQLALSLLRASSESSLPIEARGYYHPREFYLDIHSFGLRGYWCNREKPEWYQKFWGITGPHDNE